MKVAFIITLAIIFSRACSIFIHDGKVMDYKGLDVIEINLNEYNKISNTFPTKSGITKYKAQQQYKGVDIFGATLVISQDSNNKLSPVSGTYYETKIISSDFNNDVTPLITSDVALQIAIQHYIPNGDESDLFGYEYGESQRTTKNTLNLYKNIENGLDLWTLSYVIEFSYLDIKTENVHRPFSVIDAKSGLILFTFNPTINENAWGTGGNAKIGNIRHGPMPINQSPEVENDRVQVFDYISISKQEKAECIYSAEICEIQDYLINTAPNCLADAYKYGNNVFDLYDAWGPPGSTPVAPHNLPLRFYVHYGKDVENAVWSGGAMYFGDGRDTFYPFIAMDVSAHEVAHGFTEQGSDLIYSQQSGGINEAYSDLAGEAAEEFYRGKADWVGGADIFKLSCSNPWNGYCGGRYLADPPRDGSSIGRADDFEVGMDVHYSSGVYNKAFYRLSSLNGWSLKQVFALISHANLYYWGRNTNFKEGLCEILDAAQDLDPSIDTNDIEWAFGFEPFEGIDGPGVVCDIQENHKLINKSNGDPESVGTNDNNKNYYIYGGIVAGLIMIITGLILVIYFYRRRKRAFNQLNDAIGGENNFYGTIASEHQRQ